MKLSKKQERIAIIALAAFLVGYFAYQVAYGVEMTIGPNGKMTLPPGSTVSNITGNAIEGSATIYVGPAPVDLSNTTWTIYNATSRSIGTITFKAYRCPARMHKHHIILTAEDST